MNEKWSRLDYFLLPEQWSFTEELTLIQRLPSDQLLAIGWQGIALTFKSTIHSNIAD